MKKMIKDFEQARVRLREVLKKRKTKVVRDSAIKRFEICYDLAWKLVKEKAKNEGLECYSPRSCFKLGFQMGLIEHDEKWLDMIDDRNKVIHMYNEKVADEVYADLLKYLKLFDSLAASV